MLNINNLYNITIENNNFKINYQHLHYKHTDVHIYFICVLYVILQFPKY